LNKKELQRSLFKREELRGLFVLGLLAVIASIRIQSDEITIAIEQKSYEVTIFLDIMLFLWSFYAFFMVLALSEDIIGKNLSNMFREVSATYLYLSFAILAILSTVLLYAVYPTRTPWVLGFLPVLLAYWLIKKLKRKRRPLKHSLKESSKDLWNRMKSNLYQFLFSVFFVCLLLIMFGTHEEFVIPSFVIGSVALIGFLIARKKLKKSD